MEAAQPSIEDRIAAIIAPEPPPEAGGAEAPTEQGASSAAPAREEVVAQDSGQELPEGDNAGDYATDADGETDTIEISDIGDLAAHIGVDVAELYNVPIPYTKNGERHQFTLGEIKDQLQDWQDTLAKREQIESTLNEYRAAEMQTRAALEQQAQFLEVYTQHAEQALLQDMQAIDWDALHRENPGEWARQSEMFRRKAGQLQQAKQQASQELHRKWQEQSANAEKMQEQLLLREQQAALRAIPEWRDDKTAESERAAIVESMRVSGYTTEEINQVRDHRALVLARKAMLYDRIMAKGDAASKKVAHLPKKIVKPGGRQSAAEAQSDRERAVVAAHRKNPKSLDAAAARIALRIK